MATDYSIHKTFKVSVLIGTQSDWEGPYQQTISSDVMKGTLTLNVL